MDDFELRDKLLDVAEAMAGERNYQAQCEICRKGASSLADQHPRVKHVLQSSYEARIWRLFHQGVTV